MARQNIKRSGSNSGGGGPNGGGGKRGIPINGWEKGDIARDMVIQKDDPAVPLKPGSSRIDRTLEARPETSTSPAKSTEAANPLQFQFNSDNQTNGDTRMAQHVEEIVRARLSRVEDRLTRVEVHVGDVNGPRGGSNNKSCVVEVRPNGMAPITATSQGASYEAAATDAADKALKAFDRQIGKRTTRKGH